MEQCCINIILTNVRVTKKLIVQVLMTKCASNCQQIKTDTTVQLFCHFFQLSSEASKQSFLPQCKLVWVILVYSKQTYMSCFIMDNTFIQHEVLSSRENITKMLGLASPWLLLCEFRDEITATTVEHHTISHVHGSVQNSFLR